MKLNKVRQKYLEFFQNQDHTIIPSASLVPENDPTTLFTSSGMQPMVPYLMGEKHPEGVRLTDSQKCFRADDIDDVGDNRHTTFFEMLGNWSLGDYFKAEQLPWIFAFLTNKEKGLGLDPAKIYITTFIGDEKNQIPKDEESIQIWQNIFENLNLSSQAVDIGTEADGYQRGMKEGERIFAYSADKNWWSRSGKPSNMPVGEIGGPDSELFYDFGTPHDESFGPHCHPNCDCGRFIEIGNSVFMEYIKTDNGFEKLPQQNVDFGGGLERLTAATNGSSDVFTIDVFRAFIEKIEQLSGKQYQDSDYQMSFRIIADHFRGAVFMIGDNILPANSEQGYFVRRLLRRAIIHSDKIGLPPHTLETLVDILVDAYEQQYPELADNRQKIIETITVEENKFRQTLQTGLRKFEKLATTGKDISGQNAFVLFTTYGFPLELTLELATEKGLKVDEQGYEQALADHQAKSRAGAEQKFKGGLADHSEINKKYHTATHLLNAALHKVLGDHITQRGSNITTERLRFDFSHEGKLSDDERTKIEGLVNQWIKDELPIAFVEMTVDEAFAQGALGAFGERYPERVKVYTIGNDTDFVSREICGGPHVHNTKELQTNTDGQPVTFKIKKEKASSAGIRRIRAVFE